MREKELGRERIRRQKQRRRRRRIRRCFRMLCALFFCVLGIWLFGNVLIDTGALTALGKKMNGSGSLWGSYAAPETLPDESESEIYVLRAEAETAAESGLQNADFQNARIETESPKAQDIPSVPEVDLTQLYSPYAILVDPDSGTVIAEKNSRERIYPASLTKIMTAVIVLENMEDLNETIVLPGEMFSTLMVQHASLAGFEPGESVSVKDLLYGILLPSGAECCIACADRIAGSEDAFVELMNAKAGELGMKNTHFCNSTGLHEEEHYSTVQDISVLLQYALKNNDFLEIFESERHVTAPDSFHPDGLVFESTMFQYLDRPEVTGGRILGGKTGYTSQAGLCLASLADIDGQDYILVTAKADGTHQTQPFHILDAVNVYGQIGDSFAADR